MASNYVLIDIAAGVFLAGIAIGYGNFANANQPIPSQQLFGGMMQNLQMMNEWNHQMM